MAFDRQSAQTPARVAQTSLSHRVGLGVTDVNGVSSLLYTRPDGSAGQVVAPRLDVTS